MRKVQGYFIDGSGQKSTLLTLEATETPEERARGLMFRAALAPSTGMLFDFGKTGKGQAHSLWMKDTYIPLDVAWLSEKGLVVDFTLGMKPLSLVSHKPGYVGARYAIELPAGWLADHNVGFSRVPSGVMRIKTWFRFCLVRQSFPTS